MRLRRAETDSAATVRLEEVQRELADARGELAQMLAALDGLPLGVIFVDAKGHQRAGNAPASSLGGAAHGDVLVREAVEKHVARAITGVTSESTLELFGPPRRVLHVRAVPLPDGGAVVTVDDISERARLDAVRTDFVANISHELKTPVGAVAVLAEAMVDEDDPAVLRRLASKAADEAHRAAEAIDELLQLSRIEMGGGAVWEIVDARLVVDEAADRVRELAQRLGVVLVVGEVDTVKILGDRRQLVSAIRNLLENAVKYSEAGDTVRVGVTTRADVVEFAIEDEGIGIPARDLPRIFERFYRVDRARSRDTGGTGLGLAIVHHVATNHGGDVSARSVEGEGSVFTFWVPVAT